jgi:hypothetical protein
MEWEAAQHTGVSLARVRIWRSDKIVDDVHSTRKGVLLVCCGGHCVAIDTVQASITDPELLEELAFVKPCTKGVLMEVLGSHAGNWNERGVVVRPPTPTGLKPELGPSPGRPRSQIAPSSNWPPAGKHFATTGRCPAQLIDGEKNDSPSSATAATTPRPPARHAL